MKYLLGALVRLAVMVGAMLCLGCNSYRHLTEGGSAQTQKGPEPEHHYHFSGQE